MFGVDDAHFVLPVVSQLCLWFGLAGLLWPERVKPVFEVLMFPWFPTHRDLRVHSVVAILISLLTLAAYTARSI